MQHLFRACETNMSNLISVSDDEQVQALWRHQMETFSALLALCPGNSPVTLTKGRWRGALMFSFICAWINGWVNNREAGDLRRHRAHYDVIVMETTQNTGIHEYTKKCLLTLHITKGQVTSFLWRFCFSITDISIFPWRSRTGIS